MASGNFILFLGGALGNHLRLARKEEHPTAILTKLGRGTEFPPDEQLEVFQVLEWATRKVGRQAVLKRLTTLLDIHKRWPAALAMKGLCSSGPSIILSTWFDPRISRLFRTSRSLRFHLIHRSEDLQYINGANGTPIYPLLGTLDHPSGVKLAQEDLNSLLHVNSLFHSYTASLLATRTWLFVGFELAPWFDFTDFYARLRQMVPKSERKDIGVLQDPGHAVARERLEAQGLSFVISKDVTPFLHNLGQAVIALKANRREQTTMLLPSHRPYKYLDPYQKDDVEVFRGRSSDATALIGLILGSESTILVGKSGVGKTSILDVAVRLEIEDRGLLFVRARVLPDPARGLAAALGASRFGSESSGRWLKLLQSKIKQIRPPGVVVVFDQFEEFFSEHSPAVQRDFWEDITNARSIKPNLHLVFCIRQDAFHFLNTAFPALPKPYASTFFLESLSRSQQREVIEIPARLAGQPWSNEVVEQLLNDIAEYPGETAHLSIVLTTLWDHRRIGTNDLNTYSELGGVAGILRNYLWTAVDQMPKAEVVRAVLKAFVSPDQRKSQVMVADLLAELSRKHFLLSSEEIQRICEALVGSRLLRQVSGVGATSVFELSHDLLASAIGETINAEEIEEKYAKRAIRSAKQDFSVTRIVPGWQEAGKLCELASRGALLADDFLFLALCAAHNGRDTEPWLNSAVRGGAQLKQFFAMCIAGDSLLAKHEVLRRITANRGDNWIEELKAIAVVHAPSLQLHLADLSRSYGAADVADLIRPLLVLPGLHVTIPAGSFIFGISGQNRLVVPESEVWVDEFVMDRFPVTNLQYREFVNATGHRAPRHWNNGDLPAGLEYHPVTYLSWYDAASYAQWSGKRLPTEAEWEKAGYWDPQAQRKRLYPWGDIFDRTKANYHDSNIGSTSPIGQYSPAGDSAFGVTDMAGNVYDWLLDDAIEPFKPFPSTRNPIHIAGSSHGFKMTRGGSYGGPQEQLQCGFRGYSRSSFVQDTYVGFRCVSSHHNEHSETMIAAMRALENT